MKFILSFFILVIFSQNISAYCIYKIPCVNEGILQSNANQQKINTTYNKLDNSINESEKNYQKYEESLNKQNELLEKIIKLRKYNNMSMKKVNFLLSKIINNKNITIDVDTLKSIQRLNKSILKQENK